METGKVEYAPDYKSVRRDSKGLPIDDRGWPIMEVVDGDFKSLQATANNQAEHARLQAAVVEAAKRRRKAKLATPGHAGDYLMELHAAMVAEHSAVDALTAFEAEHKIESKPE